MNQLYRAIGISKQAVHKQSVVQSSYEAKVSDLIVEADAYRALHPGCGVEKLYYALNPDFMGRDKFVSEFMELGYRLPRKRNYRRTTISSLIYRPNLIQGLTINSPSTVWQSDITYINVGNKHYYAVFIIDVYSKEIVGYEVADNMRASANIRALKMALGKKRMPLIHHSDRGSQYISKAYTKILEMNGAKISMGLTAQDNAYAERINRTIKEEYLDHWKITSLPQLKKRMKQAVDNYNNLRPHRNLGMLTPDRFIRQWENLPVNLRSTITIFKPTNN